MVSLHRRFYGKGPTKAKTYAVNDTVICFQRAMEEMFTAVVENALGRKVIAYMSQIHADPDMAVELFVLGPDPAAQDLTGEHGEVVETHEATEGE
jgi:uncharacterized protein YbcI